MTDYLERVVTRGIDSYKQSHGMTLFQLHGWCNLRHLVAGMEEIPDTY